MIRVRMLDNRNPKLRLFGVGVILSAFLPVLLSIVSCAVAPGSEEKNLSGAGNLSPASVISGQYDVVWVTGNQYFVQNDIWNGSSGAQVLNVDPSTGNFTVQSSSANLSTSGPPMSYASIVKGNHYNTVTANSGMPIQVSAISSLNSTWSIALASGYYDCAYDIWFNNGTYTGGNYNGAELMIWINHSGPPQPVGSVVETVSIAGASWNVWFGNIGWNVISFVRTSGTTSVSFDIKQFIQECVNRGYINTSWNLEAVEAGFELWQGGAGLQSSGYTVAVNGGGGGSGGGTSSSSSSSSSSTGGGGSAYAVHYSNLNDWGVGATINVTIRNNSGSALNGWSLKWNFPGNQNINNIWNATSTQNGNSITANNMSYNNVIGANGGTQSFGFNINYSGADAAPTAFTLNGVNCTLY